MKYVFLDLDNTLTDRKATVSAYAEFFSEEFRDSLKDSVSNDYLTDTFIKLDKGGYETHDARSESIRDLKIWKNSQSAVELSLHWQNWVPNNSLPMSGLYECLSELLDMSFRLCLVSNGQSKNQRDKIKKLSLDQYFEKIVISEEVGFKKPDHRIFKFALSEMGCSAEDVFFIGDHPVNDYKGSSVLGFTGIWFEGAHTWPEGQDRPLSIRNLGELCPMVRNLTNKGMGRENRAPML